MLMMILAATTAAAEVPPQRAEQPRCRAGVILVSRAIEPERAASEPALMPGDKPDAKGPAVLTPECKPQKGKSKDYPMA